MTSGQIGDFDVEVKWGCARQEGCPGGDGCVLEAVIMTAEELLERYAAGERDFSGVRVSAEEYDTLFDGRDLSRINLCGSTLYGNWSGVNLSNSLLYGVKGEGWDLPHGNLTRANLRGTLFAECNLTGCNFTDACLSGVYFSQVIVDEVNFSGADLRGVDFSETSLDRVNLSGA